MSTTTVNPVNITGLGLREAIALAKELGCEAWIARRTGEYVIRAPDGRRVRLNGRRKDSNRNLTVLLRSLLRQRGEIEESESADESATNGEAIELDTETDECVQTTFEDLGKELEKPIEVTLPPVCPPRPMSLLDRAAAFREHTATIVNELKSEYERIDNEQDEVLEMLRQYSEEREKIQAELKSFGAWDVSPYVGPAIPSTAGELDTNKGYIPVKERQEYIQKVKEFLQKRRGVWFTPAEICRQCGINGSLHTIVSQLVGVGDVERRGEKRATQYRCPTL